MPSLKENPSNYKLGLSGYMEMCRFFWRYRSQPDALEPLLASLKDRGVPETNLSNVHIFLLAWRQAYLSREVAAYPIDNYLTAGMGAVDLILLTIVLPMGVPDRPLFIALLSLVVSLVLVATALFVGFVKRNFNITAYGNVHGTVISLALASGTAAFTAALWHASSVIGIVFLVLAVLAFIACASYFALVHLTLDFIKLSEAASAETPAATPPTETSMPVA